MVANNVNNNRAAQPVVPDPASEQNVMPGFGGASQWETTERYVLSDPVASRTPGNEAIPFDQAGIPTGPLGDSVSALSKSIEQLSEANASMLRGEIPADVSASVRRAASETSVAGGVFGSAGRALSARDLGKTSYEIKKQGLAVQTAVVEARSGLSEIYEKVREYDLSRNMALTDLSYKARELNLSAIEQERQRVATNIQANVNILRMLADLKIAQQEVSVTAASQEIDPANIMASFDSMIAALNDKLIS